MPLSKKSLSEIITDFIEYCEIERGLSPTTTLKYHYRLTKFLIWAKAYLNKSNLSLKDLDLLILRKFRVALSRKQLKESTQYNFMVTIRAFLKYLVKHDFKVVGPEKIELGRYDPARSLKFLKPEQLDKLMVQPDTGEIAGLRDRVILEVLFSTGLRVSELANLNKDQIDLKSKEFSVVGKGNRRRVVFLSETAAEWVKKYLDQRQDHDKPLFLSYSGPKKDVSGLATVKNDPRPSRGSKSHENISGSIQSHLENEVQDPDGERFRLSVRSIQRLVKKYTKQAGVNVEVTPHVLRHSFATDLLMSGADLRTVQESLGHKNVATTQIYTHITNLQLKKAHQQFHGKWRKSEQ